MSKSISAIALSLVLVVSAGAFGILSGCTSKSNSQKVKVADGRELELSRAETLRFSIASEPPTLDWNKATDATSSQIYNNLMEGLVSYNLADKELALAPGLALEWKALEKARVWTFKLRQGVKWSDGVDFKAEHVVDGWKRLLARETASEYAYFLFALKNAKAFNEGKVSWDKVGVSIPSPDTIRVELEKPMGYFPQLLTHGSTFPVRLDVIAKHGDKWTEAGNLVTLGAYRLAHWQHDREILMEANETYYGGRAATKYVHFQMIAEQTTAINLFDAGKLDSVDGPLPSTELKTLRKRKEFRTIGLLQMYYYGFNTKKAPFDNLHFRRAVAHAIDRQKLVQVLDGGEIPLTGWVPSGMFGYFADVGLEFNLEKARAELAKSGFGDGGKKMPALEIHFNTNENHQRIAEIIQSQLKENLGLAVELKNEEWKSYLSKVKSDTPQIFRLGWLADYPDPDNFMNLMTSYSDNNHTKWADKTYDSLVEQAATETDLEKRRDTYRKASRLFLEESAPAVPLFTSVLNLLISDRIENFPVNAMRRFEYKAVRIKQ